MLPYIDIRELLVWKILDWSRLTPVQLFSMGRPRLGLPSMSVSSTLMFHVQSLTDPAQ